MIVVENVSKVFKTGLWKREKILDNISLHIRQGSITGFAGLNGAGKTTLIHLLMGFTSPDDGHIAINSESPTNTRSKQCLGYLPEQPKLYEHLSALETLRFAGLSSGLISAEIQDRSERLLQRLDLAKAGDKHVYSFSKGMKQRLGLAMAMIHDPAIYLLDEPMSGLDPLGRQLVKDVIAEERERGKTIFFSTHILHDVEQLCTTVEIIKKGRIVFSGDVDGIKSSSQGFEQFFMAFHREQSLGVGQ